MSLGEYLKTNTLAFGTKHNGSTADMGNPAHTWYGSGLSYVAGRFGNQCVSLTGTSSSLNSQGGSNWFMFPDTTFTISMWINPSDTGATQYLFSQYGGTFGGWNFYLSSMKCKFIMRNSAGTITYSGTGAKTISAGVWTHVCCVITTSTTVAANNTIVLYVNGSLDTVTHTRTSPYSYSATPGSRTYIYGDFGGGTSFGGKADECFLDTVGWNAQNISKYVTYTKGRYAMI